MRILTIVAACVALGGCWTSGQDAATANRAGDQFVGQNVDAVVGAKTFVFGSNSNTSLLALMTQSKAGQWTSPIVWPSSCVITDWVIVELNSLKVQSLSRTCHGASSPRRWLGTYLVCI